MAYAALISLENTIHRILKDDRFSITLDEKQQIKALVEPVNSFQLSLEKFPNKFNSLERRMMELAHEAEDILEYFVLKKVFSSPNDENEFQLERLMGEIDLIAQEVEKIKGSPSSKDVQRGADSSTCSSSSGSASASLTRKDAMVGFEDYVLYLKERLCEEGSKLEIIPICGMGGIGKTTLAKNVYDDPLIVETFDIRVWSSITQDYTAERIISSLLDSLKEFDTFKFGETHKEKLHKILTCRRFLVVVDDIWSHEALNVVINALPDNENGSRVLLTTRLSDVGSFRNSSCMKCEMHLMDAHQSWNLFKQKALGDHTCPFYLENIGKEIARRCQGLPLAIVVIAGVVSTVSQDLSSWAEIAENMKSMEQNQIEEILALSYIQLPQYLRPCFLYMGSFPEDEEIKATKLIRMWVAEGFLKSPDSDNFEKVAEDCLEELAKRNLVLVTKRKCDGRIKTCGLHDVMRDLCITKAHESQFFLNLMDRHVNEKTFVESIRNQRRINVDSSNLMYLSSSYGSSVHSIKCSRYGLVKLDFVESVRSVRVLDAEATDVEYSPLMGKLAELFHLRYLAISYCHASSIFLWDFQNLQTLIINREKFLLGIDCYLVLEWCMPQLRHVYFYDIIIFDDPEETSCFLGSLQTISYVSHESCIERILKKIPNLKKLKVDCSDNFNHREISCLNDLVHLHRLECLEVYAGCWVQSRPKYYSFTFPRMLKKLILRDLVLPWNDIVTVDSLPNLQVLKLKGCTCVGGTWETTEGEFPKLRFLLIEDCDLKNWVTESSHFPRLRCMLLHSCENLNAIPNDIGEIPTIELIEVNGVAKKSLVKSVLEIQSEQDDLGNNTLQVICAAESSGHERFDSDEHEDDDDNNNYDEGDDGGCDDDNVIDEEDACVFLPKIYIEL